MLLNTLAPIKREQLDLRGDAIECFRRRPIRKKLGQEPRIKGNARQIARSETLRSITSAS